jgi:AcrR family transcriptional regulator
MNQPRTPRSADPSEAPETEPRDGRGGTRTRLTRKGEATRRAILDASLALFAKQGYHRTTVPDIVEAAGIGHGTFYEYFNNRRDVLVGLTTEAGAARRQRQVRHATLAEHLRLDIIWWLSDFVSNLELSKVWDEAEAFDDDIREARNRLRQPRLDRIKRAIEIANPRGIDPEVAARALLAMMEEFAQRWFVEDHMDRSPTAVFAVAETLANLWINAVKAEGVVRERHHAEVPGEDGPAGEWSRSTGREV